MTHPTGGDRAPAPGVSDHGPVSDGPVTEAPASTAPASSGPTAGAAAGGAPASSVPPKKKHGRETATDMIRSLGLVLLIIVPMWWLAQSPQAEERVRRVDPATEVLSFTRALPLAPVPGPMPQEWVPTVASYTAGPDRLRVGYVISTGGNERYAEFNAVGGGGQVVVDELTGGRPAEGSVDVNGEPWSSYRDAEGRLSLVRQLGPATVVVGGPRSTATPEELRLLAASVVPARS